MPYTQQLNDKSTIERRFVRAEGFCQMICDQFDVLYKEGAKSGRVMAIALHPYLIGVPHRIGAFDAALKYICKHKKVWKATGSEIARHYRAQLAPAHRIRRRPPRENSAAEGTMTRFVRVALALLFALGLLAAPQARATDTVSIGLVGSTGPTHWPIHIGLKKGYYAAENIKLDLVFIQSSGAVLQQLAAGSLDTVLSAGLTDPINAIDKGAPISIVRLEMQLAPYAVNAKAQHKKFEDLKGKIVMVDGPKGITKIYLERMLARAQHEAATTSIWCSPARPRRASRRCSPARSTPPSCCRRSASRPRRRATAISG